MIKTIAITTTQSLKSYRPLLVTHFSCFARTASISFNSQGTSSNNNSSINHNEFHHCFPKNLKVKNLLDNSKYATAYTQNKWFSIDKSRTVEEKQHSPNKNLTEEKKDEDEVVIGIPDKLSLFAKFKLMYKQYWYVLIPVHVVTSIGWFGGFYYLSKSGVDIPALLQTIHVSEVIIEKLKYSNMGHYAISYLCYKLATPVRYGVTLGGTTVSIKYLVHQGWIKPVPTKKEIIEKYQQKKAEFDKRKSERKSQEK